MKYLALLFITVTVMCFSCSQSIVNNGSGGSEITNGKVIACDGKPATGIPVTAYPKTYIEGKSDTLEKKTAITDQNGKFTIDIDSGIYNVFIIDTLSASGNFLPDVGPKQNLNTIYLDTLGSISGTVDIDEQRSGTFVIIYCTGTPLQMTVLPQGNVYKYMFKRVPTGEYSLSIAKITFVAGCPIGEECGVKPGNGGNSLENIRVESGKEASFSVHVNIDSLGQFEN